MTDIIEKKEVYLQDLEVVTHDVPRKEEQSSGLLRIVLFTFIGVVLAITFA